MGEAKRKKLIDASKPSAQAIAVDQREMMAEALRRVVGAVTDFHGADCIMYAQIGAELLLRQGLDAKRVAGGASWRVGPGDGDVVSHVGSLSMVVGAPVGVEYGAMFHAWIEVGDTLIDFTTHSLRDKAGQLDDMDGGHTQVDWAPPYLWIDRANCQSHKAVAMAPGAGGFSYVRNSDIEKLVFADVLADEDVQYLADGVEMAMRMMAAGQELKIIGVGGAVLQDADTARFMSRARGVARFDTPRG